MARGIRIEYPGAFYHVMARGNRRERIFREDDDRRFFCQTLGEACQRTGWKVHAWVLDYIHLNPARVGLVRVEEGESVRDYPWSSVATGYAVPAT